MASNTMTSLVAFLILAVAIQAVVVSGPALSGPPCTDAYGTTA